MCYYVNESEKKSHYTVYNKTKSIENIARSLFGIPASSYTSERIFSVVGRILNDRRQNFSDEIIDDMLFINNLKKLYFDALY